MTIVIKCDECPRQWRTNATTRAKCPSCGKSVEIRDEVVVKDGKPGYYW